MSDFINELRIHEMLSAEEMVIARLNRMLPQKPAEPERESSGLVVSESAPDVDALAQFIRQIDGDNTMGAGTLAEKICEWIAKGAAK